MRDETRNKNVFFLVCVLGDSTCGQRALYPLGMTGLPIVNVNNNCSTGTTCSSLNRFKSQCSTFR